MKTILVVEDNESTMHLTRYLLTTQGYNILEATCGLDGVEIAKEKKPDLILMDIQLPDINGLQATKLIREEESLKEVPIVAFTSYTQTNNREEALAAGCNGYIQKPMKLKDFMQTVETLL